jgi:PAS domain S-box-containing protein
MTGYKNTLPATLLATPENEYQERIKSDEYIRHVAAIVESSDDAIISKSSDGIIKSWNKGGEKMFGFTAAEAVGKHISIIIPAEYINEEKLILEKVCHNEVIDHYETIRNKKNGERIFVSLTVFPLKNKDGKIIGVSKIVRDISARKNAEKEIVLAQQQLVEQNKDKELRAAELHIANEELIFQNNEKEKRAAELLLANKELVFQNKEKEKRAAELSIANKELAFQNEEKEKRAAELSVANGELVYQNNEKEKRAAELGVANKELAFQNEEKEKRAAELSIANTELIYQNNEKEKRAAELGIANEELAFQNEEKEKRAAELSIANKELLYQNNEKGKRAAELGVANKELAFQNEEKEKRAAELSIANKELVYQNNEKGKRADELFIANNELAFQNEEKEKRAEELHIAINELALQELALKKHNKELEQFAYVASHDLQEPLRTVSNYMQVFAEDYLPLLDKKALAYLGSVNRATERMSNLIKSLLEFSRLGNNSKVTSVNCATLLEEVVADLDTIIHKTQAKIEIFEMPVLNLYEIEVRQLFQNLITNAIKFHKKNIPPVIQIRYSKINDINTFSVSDNGIGIDSSHFERAFEIFQRLPTLERYEGNGIGLANCKKIVQLHHGEIKIDSTINQGTTIHFTLGNLTLT